MGLRSDRLVVAVGVVVVMMVLLDTLAVFKTWGTLVDVVDSRVGGVRRIFGDNVPRVDQSWEIAQDAKHNVDKRVT